jgi:predicted DNA-binding protein (MmcQ/YjbR family)
MTFYFVSQRKSMRGSSSIQRCGISFFKCEADTFAELVERDGVMPASYIGRYHWVAVRLDALTVGELKKLIAKSHELILKKLPPKLKLRLIGEASAATAKGHRRSAAARASY